MQLTLETHLEGEWHCAATLELQDETRGYAGASIVDYEIDYFARVASAEFSRGKSIHDHRALSVRYPVNLESRHSETWPAFLLDMMPQGHARRMLATSLRIPENERTSDVPLLMRAATGGIGNIRIREAADAEAERLANIARQGVTEAEILDRSDRFMEVADRFGILASGSSGLQGEWPKVAMTQAQDGLYYPDSFVSDDEAVRHVIVKLLRSNDPADRLILQGEAIYSRIAIELGLNVLEASTYANGVLIIPRFDRAIDHFGKTVRRGQESLVSAIGVSEFGYIGTHERYIEELRRVSTDPMADTLEYLKRDMANLALGNPDNHGRNSALTKLENGMIRLAPLFDFAPMRLAPEGIVRSTRWASMRDSHRDHQPDWRVICNKVASDPAESDALLTGLRAFATRLKGAPALAAERGAHVEIHERAMSRCIEITDSVLAE